MSNSRHENSCLFLTSPLITPERLLADPDEAFSVLPSWVRMLEVVHPEGPRDAAPVVVVAFGRSDPTAIGLSPVGAALLCEFSRFPGVSIVTNRNGKRSDPRSKVYARITIAGYPEDLTMVSRVFANAEPHEQVKVSGSVQSDLRPGNLVRADAEKLGKSTRAIIEERLREVAERAAANGIMLRHISVDSYMDNLKRLLEALDSETFE